MKFHSHSKQSMVVYCLSGYCGHGGSLTKLQLTTEMIAYIPCKLAGGPSNFYVFAGRSAVVSMREGRYGAF